MHHASLRTALLSLVLIVAGFAGAATTAPSAPPAMDPEARAKALLEVLPKPRPERKAFVEANFAPELIARRGIDELTGLTADLNDDLGPAKLVAVRGSGAPDELELVLHTPSDEWFALKLRFDAQARIAGVGLMPTQSLGASGPQGPVKESELAAAIAKAVDARVALPDGQGFSGAVIVAKDGVPVFAAANGEANRATHRANTLDTPVNLGSMNKMFTALVIARLVEQGKLGWDDKVGKLLPDWPQQQVREQVTVAELLDHTSGLKEYWGEAHDKAAPTLDTVKEYAALCADQAPSFTPGERFQYSNCGFVVLGAIAERVTGKDYYDLVREMVYQPAGMTHSDHYDRSDDASGRAIGYLMSGEDNSKILAKRGAPAGGGYASANDLLKFATALRAGKIVAPATLALMTTKHSTMGPPGGTPPGAMQMGYGYGFGIIPGPSGGEGFFGHNGGAPGVNADLAMFPSGWTVIVVSNVDRGAESLARRLQMMVGTRTPR